MVDAESVGGYRVLEQLYSSSRTLVYRVHDPTSATTWIAKTLATNAPPDEAAILRREYEYLRTAKVPGLVRVVDLLLTKTAPVLLMHDLHGSSLRALTRERRLRLEQVLHIAEEVAHTLHYLHEQGIIHRDITPSNVLYNPQTEAVAVIDLGAASQAPGLRVPFHGPGRHQGTFAYMAPEQTGRVNCGVDHRADLYGFGATLYELLTGRPPFLATDPLDLVHCHIARQPPPPSTLDPRIPPTISALVMKLLAKHVDDRYPSARDVHADLRRIHSYWQTHGVVPEFVLTSTQSRNPQFHLGNKLYGRGRQTSQLHQLFAQAQGGHPTIAFIRGEPGVGKTSLVRDLYGPITEHHGYFVSGKCQQLGRQEPLAPLAMALEELSYQIGGRPQWREKIRNQVGEDAGFVVDAFGFLAPLLGCEAGDPVREDATPEHRKSRLRAGISNLLNAFTTENHPLVCFVDDLQWADVATLDTLEFILTQGAGSLLFLGAFRTDEVPQTHPLQRWLSRLDQAGHEAPILHLEPLGQQEVCALISDVFRVELAVASDLADIAVAQTRGNPFFLIHYLRALCDEGLVTHDPRTGTWRWDPIEIQHVHASSNVIDFLTRKLQKLPASTRQVVELAACIGGRFSVAQLAILWPGPDELYRALEEAIGAGLILPEDDRFRFAQHLDNQAQTRLRFAHDRIHQAAATLLDGQARASQHLKLARAMARKGTRSDDIFEIVDQYIQALNQVDDPHERIDVANLLLNAGRRARGCTALNDAHTYLSLALEIFDHSKLKSSQRDDCCLELAECTALMGNEGDALCLSKQLLERPLPVMKRARVLELRLLIHVNHNRMELAIASAIEALALLGVEIPATPAGRQRTYNEHVVAIELMIASKPVESWVDLPALRNPTLQAAMRVLRTTLPAAFQCDTQLFALLVTSLTVLSIRHGNCRDSPTGYTFFGVLQIVTQQNYTLGQRFGRLGMELDARQTDLTLRSWVYFGYATFIVHWIEPLEHALPLLEESVRWAREVGDQTRGGYSVFHLLSLDLSRGAPLRRIQAACERQLRDLQSREDRPNLARLRALVSVVRALHEPESGPRQAQVDEAGASNQTVVHYCQVLELQRAVLLDLYGSSLAQNLKEIRSLAHLSLAGQKANLGKLICAENVFYAAIALVFGSDELSETDAEQLASCCRQLATWAGYCPQNFHHRSLLLEAETARRKGQTQQALKLYEQSIHEAQAREAHHDAAFACELAGVYLQAMGVELGAKAYLQQACDLYRSWGALTKTDLLQHRYPDLLGEEPPRSSTVKGRGQLELDLAAVVKASEALTRIASLEQLCSRLMEVVMEEAGAQRVVLLLREEARWVVVAEVVTAQGIRSTQTGLDLEQVTALPNPDLPGSVLQQTLARETSLIIEDAEADPRYVDEVYIRQNRPRSLMCMPLRRSGTLNGLLYLENRLLPGAFSRDRLQILDILSGQITISIDNARAYEQMRNLNRELEQRIAAEARAAEELRTLNAELTRTRDRALEANRAKSAFLANMSHELRTPLNAIIGYTELVLEEQHQLSSDGSEDLSRVLRAAAHLLKLIDEVLDLSRVESGHTQLAISVVDVHELMRGIEQLVAPLLRAHQNTSLSFDCPPELGTLTTDETRLKQLLINLVSNAIKFTHAGTIEVTVTSHPCEGFPGLLFTITDTGIGIDASQLSRVFEPFTQADESSTRRYGGTGLGLAISRHFAEAMGGNISVESTLHVGTTFRVWLPRRYTPPTPAILEPPANLDDYA